jgi:hypothetical protein
VLGVHRFSEAKEQGKEMGHAAGTAAHSATLFNNMGGLLQSIPGDYAGNYQNKKKQAEQLAAMSADKAKTVFFEPITPHA